MQSMPQVKSLTVQKLRHSESGTDKYWKRQKQSVLHRMSQNEKKDREVD